MLDKAKTIVLDYDGTLHDSIKIYGPAFRKAYKFLVDQKQVPPRIWEDEEIIQWLGLSSKEMWEAFMPDMNPSIREQAGKIIGEEMNDLLQNKKAVLYEGALETLEYLKNRGYKLVFLSNCGRSYMEYSRDLFGLDHYFDEMLCAQDYDFIPKYEILSQVMVQLEREIVVVGDRYKDMEAGKRNNLQTIGCQYGYAQGDELLEADYKINHIKELCKLL
ncbi:HAD family hydrolase [Petrocella atlantisensis]|uniref:HAD family hydrolase n=1 Tax=Petrocella atlantisensis TaxID=2173034 RepID=A0A3P7S1B7_9FIRM|nr:HAD family hydrolase [Petrocella atlantisensis]VDN48482.1 HAD family hydrolase [Petrocella atlantisensis]